MPGVNVWAQVGASTFTLVMEALYGTSNQLLGMNTAANALQYKSLTYDNVAGQLANTVGAVGAPAYVFQGDLTTGWYRPAAAQWAWSAAGAQKLLMAATGFTFSAAIQMSNSLIKEDFGADIAAAATTDLGTATGNVLNITNAAGATTITSLGGATLPSGTEIETIISITGGSISITHDAVTLILLGGVSLPLVDKDVIRWRKTNDAAANWRMVSLQRGVNSSILANKGDIVVGTLSGGIIIPSTQAVGTDGQVLTADSTKATGLAYVDNTSRPILNINPNWQIDQIFEGTLSTYLAGTGRIADGWWVQMNGGGVFKCRTIVDPDNAALKCLEITCTTADAAIAAAEFYNIFTAIEGYDCAALMAGTANALPVTIQFKFKSNITGVYGVQISNSTNTRRYVSFITVPDTGEHEYSISFVMDTAGAWLYTNGTGLRMRLTLAAGSNSQTGTPNTWAAGAEHTTAAQCNFMSNIANIAYLKRVQIIPGLAVQPYKPADLQKELAKCQRYYCKTFPQGVVPAQAAGLLGAVAVPIYAGAITGITWRYPVTMRGTPNAITTYNPVLANANWRDFTNNADFAAAVSGGISGDAETLITGAAPAGGGYGAIHITAENTLL